MVALALYHNVAYIMYTNVSVIYKTLLHCQIQCIYTTSVHCHTQQCHTHIVVLSYKRQCCIISIHTLTLKAPIATKVVCFSRLLKCLRSLYGKQHGPRSDCSYRSSLFCVHTVCFYIYFVSNARQLFAADDFSR